MRSPVQIRAPRFIHDPPRHDDDRPRLRPVAFVRSTLTDPASAPRQGDEGAPSAWLEFEAGVADAMRDRREGDDVILLSWLDRADREVRVVHPRDDATRPRTGVFSTRSADRPNPIGLHRVRIAEVDGPRLRVLGLEAVDGTPIVDVKPVLSGIEER